MRRCAPLWMALLVMGCGRVPPRPANVPASAFFVGQRRDGVFVVVGAKEIMGWHLAIYGRNGALKREGVFVLRGMARAEILPEEVQSYDGTALHLSDGTLLVPKP